MHTWSFPFNPRIYIGTVGLSACIHLLTFPWKFWDGLLSSTAACYDSFLFMHFNSKNCHPVFPLAIFVHSADAGGFDRWWWRSFLTSGSMSIYVFLYASSHYFNRTHPSATYDALAGTVFFGYVGATHISKVSIHLPRSHLRDTTDWETHWCPRMLAMLHELTVIVQIIISNKSTWMSWLQVHLHHVLRFVCFNWIYWLLSLLRWVWRANRPAYLSAWYVSHSYHAAAGC